MLMVTNRFPGNGRRGKNVPNPAHSPASNRVELQVIHADLIPGKVRSRNTIMDSVDLQVLKSAKAWRDAGHAVNLVTVVETWGSAPRPPGGNAGDPPRRLIAGSVSGGCVEDDLIDRWKILRWYTTSRR